MYSQSGFEFDTLLSISQAIATRATSSTEITTCLLERIAQIEPAIGAFALVCAEEAIAAATNADKEIARGVHRGPLHGVPIALKDLLFTKGQITANGTTLHAQWRPTENATAVERLRRGGAVILGKTKMTEAAMLEHHPSISAPLNPWDPKRSCGYSSSGSGASVAAGLCYAALGSDTGGSIRSPSSANGLTGLKTTWGRVSRHGVFPLVESIDTIGPMARTAADAAAVIGVIAGHDPRDLTSSPLPVPNYLETIDAGVSGVVMGIDYADLEACCDKQVYSVIEAAADVLSTLGTKIRIVRSPQTKMSGIFPLILAGLADAHRATYPARAADYGPSLRGMLDYATSVQGMDVAAAINQANALRGEFTALFTAIDLLLVPVLTHPTPEAGAVEKALASNPGVTMDMARFTTPFNITGQPSITLRGGSDCRGLPIGFQLVGRHFEEELLLRAGHAFQRVTDWHTRHPSMDWCGAHRKAR